MRATRLGAVLAATLTATLTIGGCGSSEPAGGSEAASQSPAAPQGPVKLTYWTWAPNMDKIIAAWNKDNPDIQVTVSKQAGGDDAAAKFLTAAKAGNPPDLVQAEYQHLPSFIAADAVADLKAETAAIKGEFGEGVWGLVTLGTDAVYAVPQDSGPMMLFYRQDLFDKYGLEVPKTWQEYGDAARALRKKDPKAHLGTFSSKDPGAFTGLAQQAGAQEGRRLLGRSGEGGRHRRHAVLHPRVEQGAQRRQAADLAVRRVGAGRAVEQRAQGQGQVGRRPAPPVERR
jgi:multiple sugar transport system substrate-binding protein